MPRRLYKTHYLINYKFFKLNILKLNIIRLYYNKAPNYT
jgi:hypothetical protein